MSMWMHVFWPWTHSNKWLLTYLKNAFAHVHTCNPTCFPKRDGQVQTYAQIFLYKIRVKVCTCLFGPWRCIFITFFIMTQTNIFSLVQYVVTVSTVTYFIFCSYTTTYFPALQWGSQVGESGNSYSLVVGVRHCYKNSSKNVGVCSQFQRNFSLFFSSLSKTKFQL